MSLWAHDVRPPPRELLRAFADSTEDDRHLWRYDILGSLAQVAVLEDAGLVNASEAAELRKGLRRLVAGPPSLDPALEDVHMNVEDALSRQSAAGAKLHTARSRNDQVALDLRLYTRTHLLGLGEAVAAYVSALLSQAEQHASTPMPGRTHLQPAQTVTLGHHLHAHAVRALRDLERIEAAFREANVSPLGAGALAGTTLGTNPRIAAAALGMDGHFDNTLDAVSDRDFAIDALHAASLLLVHLSSLGEELVLWTTPEFGFVTLPPDLTTGSSLMPQKRNPDGAELLRSAATLVASDAQAALLIPRSLPLAYNRDLQDAKGPLLRGLPRAILATRVAEAMVAGAQFHPVRLAASLERGNLEATDAADALVRAGVPFREAHGRIAGLVAEAEAAGTTLASLGPAAWNRVGLAAAPPLRTDAKTTPGGPSPKLVRDAVSASRQKLSHFHQAWSARQHRVIEAEKKLEGIA